VPDLQRIIEATRAKKTGDGWLGICPGHEDGRPSFTVSDKGGKLLVRCHAGCSQEALIDALRSKGLWEEKKSSPGGNGASRRPSDKLVASYIYRTLGGVAIARKDRYEGPDGKRFVISPTGALHVKEVFYRQEYLGKSKDKLVVIVEGEKAADSASKALANESVVVVARLSSGPTTTTPGAGSWPTWLRLCAGWPRACCSCAGLRDLASPLTPRT
jgi:hypothetical protein